MLMTNELMFMSNKARKWSSALARIKYASLWSVRYLVPPDGWCKPLPWYYFTASLMDYLIGDRYRVKGSMESPWVQEYWLEAELPLMSFPCIERVPKTPLQPNRQKFVVRAYQSIGRKDFPNSSIEPVTFARESMVLPVNRTIQRLLFFFLHRQYV